MYFGTTRFDLTPESGKSMGLDLVIDAHTDQVTSSVTTPFQVNLKFVVKKEDMLKIANTYTVGQICLTRGSSRSNIGLLLRML